MSGATYAHSGTRLGRRSLGKGWLRVSTPPDRESLTASTPVLIFRVATALRLHGVRRARHLTCPARHPSLSAAHLKCGETGDGSSRESGYREACQIIARCHD